MAKKKKNTAAMRRQAELEKRQQFGKNAAKKNREKQLQNQPYNKAAIQQAAQAPAKKVTDAPASAAPVWKREDNIAPLSLTYKPSIKHRTLTLPHQSRFACSPCHHCISARARRMSMSTQRSSTMIRACRISPPSVSRGCSTRVLWRLPRCRSWQDSRC